MLTYVDMYHGCVLVEHHSGRKDNLDKSARYKRFCRFIRHYVICALLFALGDLMSSHYFVDELDGVFQSSVALNLKKHGNCREFGLC